ncbi:amidophosphoribosyltransferase [Vibrio ponticus]|nr:amidophosphoribosyltransferase [Vibrio ponticus]
MGTTPVNQSIYDALTVLQHRGQDAAGICTIESNRFRLRKANGLVKDVFEARHMQRLQGNVGIGTFVTRPQAVQAPQKLNLST